MKMLSRLVSISALVGAGTLLATASMGASPNLANEAKFAYRVIPFDSFQEESALPPKLKITFQLKCFQKFAQLIRSDEVDPATGVVEIVVGILVKEDLISTCESAQMMTLDAGPVFSGREHVILPIQ